jgi:hypothetical protein
MPLSGNGLTLLSLYQPIEEESLATRPIAESAEHEEKHIDPTSTSKPIENLADPLNTTNNNENAGPPDVIAESPTSPTSPTTPSQQQRQRSLRRLTSSFFNRRKSSTGADSTRSTASSLISNGESDFDAGVTSVEPWSRNKIDHPELVTHGTKSKAGFAGHPTVYADIGVSSTFVVISRI